MTSVVRTSPDRQPGDDASDADRDAALLDQVIATANAAMTVQGKATRFWRDWTDRLRRDTDKSVWEKCDLVTGTAGTPMPTKLDWDAVVIQPKHVVQVAEDTMPVDPPQQQAPPLGRYAGPDWLDDLDDRHVAKQPQNGRVGEGGIPVQKDPPGVTPSPPSATWSAPQPINPDAIEGEPGRSFPSGGPLASDQSPIDDSAYRSQAKRNPKRVRRDTGEEIQESWSW